MIWPPIRDVCLCLGCGGGPLGKWSLADNWKLPMCALTGQAIQLISVHQNLKTIDHTSQWGCTREVHELAVSVHKVAIFSRVTGTQKILDRNRQFVDLPRTLLDEEQTRAWRKRWCDTEINYGFRTRANPLSSNILTRFLSKYVCGFSNKHCCGYLCPLHPYLLTDGMHLCTVCFCPKTWGTQRGLWVSQTHLHNQIFHIFAHSRKYHVSRIPRKIQSGTRHVNLDEQVDSLGFSNAIGQQIHEWCSSFVQRSAGPDFGPHYDPQQFN